MLTVYCVRRAGDPPPGPEVTGPGGEAVRVVEQGAVGFWLSEGGTSDPTLEAVRAHDRVVRAALRTATPLPARYGTRFPDEAAARAALREREAGFVAALERVAGRVEMEIQVLWEVEPPAEERPEVRSGREYLEARRNALEAREAHRRLAADLLDRVEARFAALELPTVRNVLPAEGVAGALAHLVHIGRLHDYRNHLETARGDLQGVRLRVSGPWAPYSFV